MADPTLDHIDHGIESWDATINDDMDKVDANFVRSTKSAPSGQKSFLEHAEVLSAALAGASVTLAALVPAGCILMGVTTRVVTAITGAGVTSVDIGDGTTVDLYAHHTALAAGTTTNLVDHKAGAAGSVPVLKPVAGDVVITAVGGNFTGGTVRATAHYAKLTPATV